MATSSVPEPAFEGWDLLEEAQVQRLVIIREVTRYITTKGAMGATGLAYQPAELMLLCTWIENGIGPIQDALGNDPES